MNIIDISSSSPNAPPPPPPWADSWANPHYYDGITWRRIVAYLLDGALITLLATVLWFVLGFFTMISLGLLGPLQVLVIAALPFLYAIFLIAHPRSATFGMRLMGIRVLSLTPLPYRRGSPTLLQATIQTVGFYGSMTLTGSLICFVALFNPRRRTLHDWMAGVVVVRDIPHV